MGDLFAQKCMDLIGVSKQENFELTTDGACPADRPKDDAKNKKFVPNCAGVSSPSIHPSKRPLRTQNAGRRLTQPNDRIFLAVVRCAVACPRLWTDCAGRVFFMYRLN